MPDLSTPSAFEMLREQYVRRLPASLDELGGPTTGTVELPLHVVWSGRRAYGLDQPRSRMSLYRTVLAEGQREDLVSFLNRELLLAQWPVLRTLIGRPLRDAWEGGFPELTTDRSRAAA